MEMVRLSGVLPVLLNEPGQCKEVCEKHLREIDCLGRVLSVRCISVRTSISYLAQMMRPVPHHRRDKPSRFKIFDFLEKVFSFSAKIVDGKFNSASGHDASRFIVSVLSKFEIALCGTEGAGHGWWSPFRREHFPWHWIKGAQLNGFMATGCQLHRGIAACRRLAMTTCP